jgi:O-antigen/teichoic acid export membrane protein
LSDLDRRLVRGSAWLALSYGGSQFVSLVVTAILARFLVPAEFGLVALASLAMAAVAPVQDSGLGMALIHRRTDVERAVGTVFVFNIAMAIFLYVAVFAVAPLVADLFHAPDLTAVLRVVMLTLVIAAPSSAPSAVIERDLLFARRARGELAATIVRAATAIPLAIAGFGVWSLVTALLASQAVQTIFYWRLAPFRPSPRLFSFALLRQLGLYGRHVAAGNVVAFVDQNVDTVTVGRLLSSANVAYYNLAWQLANLPATGLGYIVGRVMFPAYATLQNDRAAFRDVFLTNMRRVALVSLPVATGIILAANPIVVGIFGARWQPAVAPLQILALYGLARSFTGATGAVFQAAGKPQLVLYLNVLHLLALCAALFTLTPLAGISGAAAAVSLAMFASFIPAWWLALRILELRPSELLCQIRRPAACSLPVAGALFVLSQATPGLQRTLQLILLIVVGVLVYATAALAIANDELRTIAAAFRPSRGEGEPITEQAPETFAGWVTDHVRSLPDDVREGVEVSIDPRLERAPAPRDLDVILESLLANAMSYGTPPIRIDAWHDGNGRIALKVEDRGRGIAPDFVPRLFEPGARSEASQGERPGAGLGLTRAREAALAVGGDIHFEPAAPHGSAFRVRLPTTHDTEAPSDGEANKRRAA